MTATLPRPAGSSPRPAAPSPAGAPRAGANPGGEALVIATLTVAAGALLTMLPMRSVFTDWAWLVTGIGCSAPYVAVVVASRWGGRARSLPVPLGILAAALVMCWVFIPEHLLLGVLPTSSSWGDIQALLNSAHDTMQGDRAPLQSTPGLRLLTASATVLLVALTDVLGILWRKPLLAAAPLLEVLAVASATSSRAASPIYFIAAAVGFLLILIAGTRLQDREWGPSVDGSAGRLGGARRMAITGIVAALLVPAVLPSVSTNLLARAAHHDASGNGSATGPRIELNNTADLSGSLRRGSPVDLLKVSVTPGDHPFYIRQAVLDQFTNSGWVESGADRNFAQSLYSQDYPVAPGSLSGIADSGNTQPIAARFTVLSLSGDSLPILASPAQLDAVGGGAVWDQLTATVHGARVTRNLTYSEQVNQPVPSEGELRAAPDWRSTGDATVDNRYLAMPANLPAEVRDLADRLTQTSTNSYDKARAISNYFTDPQNGFVYSLDTAPGDGRSALVTFLDKKRGFCQQYAAAAAALMRLAGLPARVVLGYTHRTPDSNGNFVVTTADAHAWVEVYFSGIGWIPFDPTPLAGADGARAVTLPWAPHATTPASNANETPSASASRSALRRPDLNNDTATVNATSASPHSGLPWRTAGIALAILIGLLAVITGPQFIRFRQRRRRFGRARTSGDPEPLWEELAASAADRGALWPDTVTVGQVPAWLAGKGVDDRGRAAVDLVARRVERARYSARGADLDDQSIDGLDQALKRWARRADRRQRLRQWWLPRSLLNRSDRRRR